MNQLGIGLISWLVLIVVLMGMLAVFGGLQRQYLVIGAISAIIAGIIAAVLLRK